jgi:hypothetical protein
MIKELRIRKSMHDVLQFLSVSIFEKTLITEVFSNTVALSDQESAFIQPEFL